MLAGNQAHEVAARIDAVRGVLQGLAQQLDGLRQALTGPEPLAGDARQEAHVALTGLAVLVGNACAAIEQEEPEFAGERVRRERIAYFASAGDMAPDVWAGMTEDNAKRDAESYQRTGGNGWYVFSTLHAWLPPDDVCLPAAARETSMAHEPMRLYAPRWAAAAISGCIERALQAVLNNYCDQAPNAVWFSPKIPLSGPKHTTEVMRVFGLNGKSGKSLAAEFRREKLGATQSVIRDWAHRLGVSSHRAETLAHIPKAGELRGRSPVQEAGRRLLAYERARDLGASEAQADRFLSRATMGFDVIFEHLQWIERGAAAVSTGKAAKPAR